jgi:3'(2'), 5'-bisphosphate nucleotidase
MDIEKLLYTAINVAILAGNKILDIYNSSDFGIELKSDNSPLTKADKESNNIIINELSNFKIQILSEEEKQVDYSKRKKWDYYWLIDPLDGTKEFIKKNDEFTVNIALMKDNYPILGVVYAPVLKDLYFAAENFGSYKLNIGHELSSIEEYVNNSIKLPFNPKEEFTVVASRSHLSKETEEFINLLKTQTSNLILISKGSSLKLCVVAEGNADLYPRFAPTMEWDIAAGHAIVIHSGGKIIQYPNKNTIEYNKKNLLNPWFLVISKNNKFNLS